MRVPGQKFFVPVNRLIAGTARSYKITMRQQQQKGTS